MKITHKELRKIIIEALQLNEPGQLPPPPGEEALLQFGLEGLNHKYDIVGLKNDPDVLDIDPQIAQLFSTDNIENIEVAISILEILSPELLSRHKKDQYSEPNANLNIDADKINAELPPEIPGWDNI